MIKANGKIQVGLWWEIDGHDHKIVSVNGNRCIVSEDWISEDTWEPVHHEEEYGIETDENGTEYAYALDYPKWKLYSTSAFNYPYESETEEDTSEDTSWYSDDPYNHTPGWKDDEEYTPSATAGDYSPSCPWNAPGMRVSDFI